MSSSLLEDLRDLSRAAGFRLALSYSLFFTVSSVLFFGLAYFLLSSSLAKRDHDDVLYKFWDLTAEYQTFDKDGLERALSSQGPVRKPRAYFIQFSAPGDAQPDRAERGQWKEFDLAALDRAGSAVGEQWLTLPSRTGPSTLEVMSLRLSDGLLLQVGQTDDDRRELLDRLRRIVLRTMVLVILASLLGGYFLARRAMRPVRDLIATIKKIEGGAVGERVPVGRSGDEFAELARLFNGMLSRIETLIAGMRGALDNVAHDLRTPLTRLRAGAEHALASSAGLDASREALADCVEESDRVVGMVETLMDISEAETGLLKLKLEDVDLAVVAEEAVELYHDTAEAKGVEIALSAPAAVPVSADRNRLRQVAANLLDNAVKYAPHGGKIRVEAFRRGDDAVLIVSDDGPGIPASEISKVWDRLYRGDASRSQRGLGLGLSVVKAVVLAHRGKVDVESEVGRGARFSCVLPAGPREKAA